VIDVESLNFEKGGGLVTVVAQDANTGLVLMVAHADRAAITRSLETGEMHYHSRTRGLWHKGQSSGNTQKIVSLHVDCDGDAVLARVVPAGPACHTGTQSCFRQDDLPARGLAMLDAIIAQRAKTDAADGESYTRKLLGDRNLRLKKLGEEAAELVTACADGDAARVREEAADLFYHALVAVHATGGSLAEVEAILDQRHRGT